MKFNKREKISIYNTYSFKMFVRFSGMSVIAIILIAYFIFSQMSDKMIQQEIKTNRQIIARTTEYMEEKIESAQVAISDIYYSDNEMQDIIDYMLNEEWDDYNISENIFNKQRFEGHFMSALYSESDIVDIVLISANGEKSYVFSKKWSTVQVEDNPIAYPWIESFLETPQPLTVIPSYKQTHMEDGPEYIYSMAAALFSPDGHRNHTGTIIINYNTKNIEKAYSIFEDEIKGEILIFDEGGNTLFDSWGYYYTQPYEAYENLFSVQEAFTGDDQFISRGSTKGDAYTVVTIISREQLYEDVRSLLYQVVIIILIFVVVLLIGFYYTSSFLVKRINLMIHAINQVQKGDLSVRIPLGTHHMDELHSIGSTINTMLAELNDYINKTYLFEIKLKENELIALQSQINPHFIYNTLEIIRVKSLMNNNHDVANMIELLSNLFRRSMKSKEIVISIKEEIDYCKDYLELSQIRFLDRLKIRYDIDERLNGYSILKSTLQPLIENIIVHSVDGSSKMVDIKIEGKLCEGDIVIKVSDTGKGIDSDKLEVIKNALYNMPVSINSEHIGMKNVSDRLRIVFGDRYGISIESQVDVMTSITIRFPAISTEDMIALMNTTMPSKLIE